MRLMPLLSGKARDARGLALAGALAAIIGAFAVSPVFAGDDGQEPIWKGLGGLIGLTGKDKEDRIDYRERARLVLPPKMALPPPIPPAAQRTAAWPVDPDVVKARKEKEDMLNILKAQSDLAAARDGNRLSPDQLRVDHAMPGQAAAANHCAAQSNSRGCDWVPFRNVLESVGLAKPDDIVAGKEPDRDWLTDPPKGYRVPTANTVATTDDTKKRVNDGDPRAALYHPPDQ
jgi:hypothetical protein